MAVSCQLWDALTIDIAGKTEQTADQGAIRILAAASALGWLEIGSEEDALLYTGEMKKCYQFFFTVRIPVRWQPVTDLRFGLF